MMTCGPSYFWVIRAVSMACASMAFTGFFTSSSSYIPSSSSTFSGSSFSTPPSETVLVTAPNR